MENTVVVEENVSIIIESSFQNLIITDTVQTGQIIQNTINSYLVTL